MVAKSKLILQTVEQPNLVVRLSGYFAGKWGISMSDSFLEVEYSELNNHLRECWKYISDLLRNFIFLQITLISLVFLSGNVIRIERINVGVHSDQVAVQNDKADSNNSVGSYDDRKFRKLAVLPLMIIAMMASVGAAVQNHRLFNNASSYVHRAAYIESKGGLLKDNRSENEKTLPPNTYMKQNLYPGKNINLRGWLASAYAIFAALWVYTFFVLTNPF